MDDKEIEFALSCAKEAAKIGAKIIKKYFLEKPKNEIEMKGISDWVTEADKKSEEEIKKFLLSEFPANFLGEEFGSVRSTKKNISWIVDPLDGTKNFTKGIDIFCVSIALKEENSIKVGVVLDVMRDEMFYACEGLGAFLNEKKISVSENSDFSSALIGTGMPFRIKEFVNLYLESYKEIFLKGAGIRNIGAAALEICYVACGRLDAFWELGLSPWDMAAGALILSEAGGIVSDFWGKQNWLETGCIIASNKKLYEPLLSIISKYFEKI